MKKTLDNLKGKLSGIRTGRANPDLLNGIQVDYYGSTVALKQLASISVSEGTILVLTVFDMQAIESIEKAILSSNLGLNPQTEGSVMRLRLPDLTKDRREELIKLVNNEIEESKVSLRNIRRDYLSSLKKDDSYSQDELKSEEKKIQLVLDDFSSQAEKLAKEKEKEILI